MKKITDIATPTIVVTMSQQLNHKNSSSTKISHFDNSAVRI